MVQFELGRLYGRATSRRLVHAVDVSPGGIIADDAEPVVSGTFELLAAARKCPNSNG